jgi:four helix bundle protein
MMKFNLEDRVIRFTVSVLKFIETLPDTKICNHLAGQLMRCSTAPTLGYGEACAAESGQDFVHKMGVALKELKETRLGLMVIQLAEYSSDPQRIRAYTKRK